MKSLLALFAAMFFAASVSAQQPIRLVVPFPAGGAGDKLGRMLQKELKEIKNLDVIVENRPGANTEIGTSFVARNKTNEVVFLLGINSMAAFAKDKDYDITRDLRPVTYLGVQPLILAAHPSMGVKNIDDLRKYGKRFSFAASTKGTPIYANSEELVEKLKLDTVIVGHRGMGEYLVPMLGNHLQVGFFAPSIIEQHVAAGSLVPLAVANKTRLPGSWKNVATFEEQGVRDFGNDLWYILMVNATADGKIVKEVQDTLVGLLSKKSTADEFRRIDIYPDPQLTLQGASLLAREIQKYSKK